MTAKFASNHKESSKILFAVCNKYYRYIPKILQICRNTYIYIIYIEACNINAYAFLMNMFMQFNQCESKA